MNGHLPEFITLEGEFPSHRGDDNHPIARIDDHVVRILSSIIRHLRNALLQAVTAAALGSVLASSHQAIAQSTFHVNKTLYSETADPKADIAAAEVAARRDHKHILLDFGGNWCGDCQLLDYYYHQAPNAELLARYFLLVHIDIGHMDHNVETARKYHVSITKGVPALAVINARGNLLYAEQEKEFEHSSPEAVTTFLKRWRPAR